MSEKILDSDIKYSDDKVTILHPHVKKGVLIVTFFTPPSSGEDLKKTGLKTGKKLYEEGKDFGRSKIHPYIFFRAPFCGDSLELDYEKHKQELYQNYDDIFTKFTHLFPHYIAIRVDPDKTKVYSSEMRTQKFEKGKFETEYKRSEKTMTEYLKVIKKNALIENTYITHNVYYNLITCEKKLFDKKKIKPSYPFDGAPIERNSEVLVQVSHLTPDYFVDC